jgi:hypothetical protein
MCLQLQPVGGGEFRILCDGKPATKSFSNIADGCRASQNLHNQATHGQIEEVNAEMLRAFATTRGVVA